MSVDGVGGLAGNANLEALVDAEIAQLSADAHALRAVLAEGDVVTARVLPSNGLTDLIEIAGRRAAASLPATVRPGEVVQAQVAGFDGDRIVLQIVAVGGDAAAETAAGPPPAGTTASPPLPPPGAATAPPGGPPSPVPPSSPQPIAPAVPPSRSPLGPVFASVVVRANVAAAAPGRAAPPAGGPDAAAGSPPPSGTGRTPPLQRPFTAPPPATAIEARIAAARASGAPPPAPDLDVADDLGSVPRQPPAGPGRFVAPPPIADKAVPAPRASPGAFAEPVALLRALRLPVTQSNIASATLALQRPDTLPAALAALEAALPRASAETNVATLRTLLAFVGRIEPGSPVLATQIAAFVDHVVDGAEPKLATQLAAHAATLPVAESGGGAAAPRPVPAALAAERGAALGADLKQTLLVIAADPATPPSLASPVTGALTALTAVQLSASQALAANPNGIAFTLPLVTADGPMSARIAIDREAPDGGVPARPDAANFRIAFVLDTARFGTVAIDLVTVGRDVSVDVRTESAPAMRAFRDGLGGLVARLESLRYRVAAAGASIGTASTVGVEAPPTSPSDPDAAVDRSA